MPYHVEELDDLLDLFVGSRGQRVHPGLLLRQEHLIYRRARVGALSDQRPADGVPVDPHSYPLEILFGRPILPELRPRELLDLRDQPAVKTLHVRAVVVQESDDVDGTAVAQVVGWPAAVLINKCLGERLRTAIFVRAGIRNNGS
jgi:hypothetical protein